MVAAKPGSALSVTIRPLKKYRRNAGSFLSGLAVARDLEDRLEDMLSRALSPMDYREANELCWQSDLCAKTGSSEPTSPVLHQTVSLVAADEIGRGRASVPP